MKFVASCTHPLFLVGEEHNMKYLTFLFAAALVLAACAGNEEEALPATYTIAEGGNLFQATADLCGTKALDEQGRGRWRRWASSDERLARAPTRWNKRLGVVVVPPGTYNIPRNLCAEEGNESIWFVAFLFLAGGFIALLLFARKRSPEELAVTKSGFRPPVRIT